MPPPSSLAIRVAVEADTHLILSFIRDLGEYERLGHEVVATEAALRQALFGPRPGAEVVIAEFVPDAGAEPPREPVGFALFFHNFSTFLGRPGLYLEDLFVRPDARGRGVGQALLRYLARLAVDRGCGRFEWSVLDWNESAIRFYRSLGAQPLEEWTVMRVTGDALERLAAGGGSNFSPAPASNENGRTET